MNQPIVYLMRGLPACGKSHTARRLAGEQGIVLETDQYFYAEVGDDPARYDYRAELLAAAREWNYQRFVAAIAAGQTPIVVDRGNGRNAETKRYARFAIDHGYRVELKEPDSAWWQEIRVLLKYKRVTREILYQWAETLAGKSRETHRVPVAIIRHWMDEWKHDLTVEDIIRHQDE
jgi:hypothetical protein